MAAKLSKFLFALVLTIGATFMLNRSVSVGNSNLPPLGKFLCPFTGFWQNTVEPEISNPKFPDLSAPAKVYFDDRMVPHIFAKNLSDAVFLQGYITASNRLWQMDISTRFISGRLAEIMGPAMLENDRLQRRMGYAKAAQSSISAWSQNPETYSLLESYTKGVNAFVFSLKDKEYPIEFKLLDYEPEPWSILKTSLFIKSMAKMLCSRDQDIASTNALEHFGQETFDYLFPEFNPKDKPIIPASVDFEAKPQVEKKQAEPKTMMGNIPFKTLPQSPPHMGSNNWVVDGKKSSTGYPILCNDPHLTLSLPSVWYEVQLHVGDAKAYGVSLPGVPGVIIGFNENTAWGMTNVSQDVQDWYKIKWADAQKSAYLIDGQKLKPELRVEKLMVKGQADVIDTVRYTKWGPVVYEDPDHPQHDLALRWVAHDQPQPEEMSVFMQLMKSKNYADYEAAMADYETPPQNIVFASKEGDIALKVQGKFPIKKEGQGRFVQDGSVSENKWQGYIPADEVPSVKNPAQGFIASANQHSTSPDYPYYYNGIFEEYRGRVINRHLSDADNIDSDDMKDFQNDTYSIKAEEALPLLLNTLDESKLNDSELEFVALLKKWDYFYDRDAAAPILFDNWLEFFYENTWDEIYKINQSRSLLYPEMWRTIALLEEEPSAIFFDLKQTKETETAKEIAHLSFRQMHQNIRNWVADGNELKLYQWKEISVDHLARIPAFSHKKLHIGGDKNCLNATRGNFGPSWRMIVELGPDLKAYGIYPGGQSGNPGSKFYDHMVQDWADGKYYDLLFMKTESDFSDKMIQVWNCEK